MISFIKWLFCTPTIQHPADVLTSGQDFSVIYQPTKEQLLARFKALQQDGAARCAFEETVPDHYPNRSRCMDGRYALACVEAAWQDFHEKYDIEVGA